jgi:hypothetical protein
LVHSSAYSRLESERDDNTFAYSLDLDIFEAIATDVWLRRFKTRDRNFDVEAIATPERLIIVER